jgi:pyruvate kinase
LDTNCPFIIVCTETGTTARLVSKYYPAVPIYALTRSPRVARQSEGFISNCTAIVVERKANDSETLIRSVIEEKVHSGKCKRGDPIVCLFGRNEGLAGATDMTRIFYA